ncbi:MAG: hypothetical protein WAU91_03145 [Desulfatitalea sp.]
MAMKHRLVSIGDSMTQGFKSGSILETNLSYPAIIAWEMGLDGNQFRYPTFNGAGGLPLNIEYLLRRMDHAFGTDVDWLELPLAAIYLRDWMDEIEDHWERGPGAQKIGYKGPYHNLAVWGFELQDAYRVTAGMCKLETDNCSEDWFSQVPERAMFRTALRVLNPGHLTADEDQAATQISRLKELADDGGVENLILYLGANNILGTVTALRPLDEVRSSAKDVKEPNPAKRKCKIYSPEHYEILLTQLMAEVEAAGAAGTKIQRVFWGTVPPVTVPPVTRGVGGRLNSPGDAGEPFYPDDDPKWYRRYFRYYTRPWIPDKKFRPTEDAHLTGREAAEIDRTIYAYNAILKKLVDKHNKARRTAKKPKDWIIVDLHWTLERLAYRRYQEDPSVPPPPKWTPYEMPSEYLDLNLTTQFLAAKQGQRSAGGLFSLDGIHPTTVAYGIMAQEFIDAMQKEGVLFHWGDGQTERGGSVRVDYRRLIQLDSLIKGLPKTMDDLWQKVVDGDQLLDLFQRAIRAL